MDDWELSEPIQAEVNRRWPLVETTNVNNLADLDGIRTDFLEIFGFGIDGVDYEADVDPTAKRE
jgi:enoyl-[acyl-carrier protein] reductase/trans-2-enoyl-CoA reductase (NAD+)